MNKNQRKGNACERTKIRQSERRGCKTIRTGKGSDFLELCPGKVPTLVEVKSRKSSLTRTQRKMKTWAANNGLGFRVDRC